MKNCEAWGNGICKSKGTHSSHGYLLCKPCAIRDRTSRMRAASEVLKEEMSELQKLID